MKNEDNNRNEMQGARKMILDALGDNEIRSEGRPASPVLPLVGSLNVPIDGREEKDSE